jgi:hypothetical protein
MQNTDRSYRRCDVTHKTDLRGMLDLDRLYWHPTDPEVRCPSCEAAVVGCAAVTAIIDDMDDMHGQEELALMHVCAESFREILNRYHDAGRSVAETWPVLVENLRLMIATDDYALRKLDPSIYINPADQLPPLIRKRQTGIPFATNVRDLMENYQMQDEKWKF